MDKFRRKKLSEPLVFTLLLNTTDMVFQIGSLLSYESSLTFALNIAYMTNSLAILGFIAFSFYNKKDHGSVRIAFNLVYLRQIISLWDVD